MPPLPPQHQSSQRINERKWGSLAKIKKRHFTTKLQVLVPSSVELVPFVVDGISWHPLTASSTTGPRVYEVWVLYARGIS